MMLHDDDNGIYRFCEKRRSGNIESPLRLEPKFRTPIRKKAIEDARKGIGMSKAFSSVEELMEDLNADD